MREHATGYRVRVLVTAADPTSAKSTAAQPAAIATITTITTQASVTATADPAADVTAHRQLVWRWRELFQFHVPSRNIHCPILW
jgi:hypothetical protein